MILSTPELAEVWDVFASPYLAYAVEPGEIGLLTHDLAPYLLPDVREPIAPTTEDALLSRLARLHARYWDGASAPSWLCRHAWRQRRMGVVGRAPLLGPRSTGSPRS